MDTCHFEWRGDGDGGRPVQEEVGPMGMRVQEHGPDHASTEDPSGNLPDSFEKMFVGAWLYVSGFRQGVINRTQHVTVLSHPSATTQ